MSDLFKLQKDYLKDLKADEVAAWYERLADLVDKKNSKVKDALAPQFLRHYIKGKGKKFVFSAPDHLKNSKYVVEVLEHHRACYLTERGFKRKWVGIIPRLQGNPPEWDTAPYKVRTLQLNSLVEIDVKWFSEHTPGDNDLMTALRGFQLHTGAHFLFQEAPQKGKLKVAFTVFHASVRDRYDFDSDEYFPVPNPDYRNPLGLTKPVAADMETIIVFHRNAIRMEKVGLAVPFDIESKPWIEGRMMLGAEIDPAKNLKKPPPIFE